MHELNNVGDIKHVPLMNGLSMEHNFDMNSWLNDNPSVTQLSIYPFV